jgi:hypothetical protein
MDLTLHIHHQPSSSDSASSSDARSATSYHQKEKITLSEDCSTLRDLKLEITKQLELSSSSDLKDIKLLKSQKSLLQGWPLLTPLRQLYQDLEVGLS